MSSKLHESSKYPSGTFKFGTRLFGNGMCGNFAVVVDFLTVTSGSIFGSYSHPSSFPSFSSSPSSARCNRNAIVVLGGERRYVLAHPGEYPSRQKKTFQYHVIMLTIHIIISHVFFDLVVDVLFPWYLYLFVF